MPPTDRYGVTVFHEFRAVNNPMSYAVESPKPRTNEWMCVLYLLYQASSVASIFRKLNSNSMRLYKICPAYCLSPSLSSHHTSLLPISPTSQVPQGLCTSYFCLALQNACACLYSHLQHTGGLFPAFLPTLALSYFLILLKWISIAFVCLYLIIDKLERLFT